ncbi:hypothetical protein LTS17_009814 [Exophiala oligosperma]
MPPKNQRRSHTKSKNGCSQCKVRRIKCNEVHPICSNCERRQISCDFSQSPGVSRWPSTNVNGHGSVPKAECSDRAGSADGEARRKSSQHVVDPFQQPDLVSNQKTTDLDITNLRLMHHFTSWVAPNLASSHTPEALALWQVYAVKLGFKHNFLLRGILAVAAFHLGYIHPEKKAEYDLIGTTHQAIGLKDFQDTLAHVDETNCHALFAFSCLLIVLAFASDAKDKPKDFNTNVVHWFYLLRGANIVLDMHSETIRCSFLKPLLDELSYNETTAAYTVVDTDQITKLFRICSLPEHDKETAHALDLAIHSLLSTFIQASVLKGRGDSSLLTAFVWPINLPPKFLDLLGEKQPAAMVILAHYCVIMSWGEAEDPNDTWFINGWARYILKSVQESIPESWQEHLQWPASNFE